MINNNKLLTDEQLLQFLIELRYNIENDVVVSGTVRGSIFMCCTIDAMLMRDIDIEESELYKDYDFFYLSSRQLKNELELDIQRGTGGTGGYAWYPTYDKQSRLDNIDRTIDRIKSRIL